MGVILNCTRRKNGLITYFELDKYFFGVRTTSLGYVGRSRMGEKFITRDSDSYLNFWNRLRVSCCGTRFSGFYSYSISPERSNDTAQFYECATRKGYIAEDHRVTLQVVHERSVCLSNFAADTRYIIVFITFRTSKQL